MRWKGGVSSESPPDSSVGLMVTTPIPDAFLVVMGSRLGLENGFSHPRAGSHAACLIKWSLSIRRCAASTCGWWFCMFNKHTIVYMRYYSHYTIKKHIMYCKLFLAKFVSKFWSQIYFFEWYIFFLVQCYLLDELTELPFRRSKSFKCSIKYEWLNDIYVSKYICINIYIFMSLKHSSFVLSSILIAGGFVD